MKPELDTKTWKVLARSLKYKISDEANKILLLTALARAASEDTNVSVPELKKVQEIMKMEIGLEVVSSELYLASKSQPFEKALLKKVCAQMQCDNSVRPKVAPSGRDSRGLQGGRGVKRHRVYIFQRDGRVIEA